VTWVRVDAERLALRFPDGQQVTFDSNVNLIERTLLDIQTNGVSRSALDTDSADERDAIRADLLDFLDKQGALLHVEAPGDDWFMSHLAFVEAAAAHESRQVSQRVSLRGSGWLRDVAAAALRPVIPCTDGELDGAPDTLAIAVSDWNDLEFFRRENERAVAVGQPITFIGRTGSEIITGPFVLPGATACFECYHRRLEFNINFQAEFAAYSRSVSEREARGERAESALARGMTEFLICRHVLAAAKRLSTILEPATILAFDCMQLSVRRTPVLKVPRCRVCGRRVGKPQRTIRDLV
jgi:bacteriocin biosynthesis cyclodehydratase domain-containing protein